MSQPNRFTITDFQLHTIQDMFHLKNLGCGVYKLNASGRYSAYNGYMMAKEYDPRTQLTVRFLVKNVFDLHEYENILRAQALERIKELEAKFAVMTAEEVAP